MEKLAPVDHPVHELLARRWSPRAFDAQQPVEPGTVLQLLEAARWSPSSSNEQPWRFLVFDARDPAAREQARECLSPGNAWAKQAPVLLLSMAQETWTAGKAQGTPNRHAAHDTGAATLSILLQATALGLACHPMAGFDAARARASFAIPEGCTPMAMIAIGHFAPVSALPENLAAREVAPRVRKPLGEVAFAGRFGTPIA
jgi:nitroreductase